ncbi:MAG: response regulator [Myxococcales bacterium]|nr:response regulator [Myxococcales bacterium]
MDDDLLVRRILSDLFAGEGLEVTAVDRAERALILARTGEFQVMVTDLVLPRMNGIDLVARCQAEVPRMRVVAMSAYASAADMKRLMRHGVVDLLVKPFQPAEAIETVERALAMGAGFQVAFDGLSLPDVLQMCHHLRRSLTLEVEDAGVIVFEDGQMVHAGAGSASGVDALVRLLRLAEGHLRLIPSVAGPRTIDRSFDNALLAAMATLDEQRAGRGRTPTTAPPAEPVDFDELSFDGLLDDAVVTPAPAQAGPRERTVRIA